MDQVRNHPSLWKGSHGPFGVWIGALFLAMVHGQGVTNLPDRVDGKEFLDSAYESVSTMNYFRSIEKVLVPVRGWGFLYDMQSRWTRQKFLVRPTDRFGQSLMGDSADGLVEGAALKTQLSFLLKIPLGNQAGIQVGVLLDTIGASHRDNFFDLLARQEHLNYGANTGFSSYAMQTGPLAHLYIGDRFSLTYMAFLKQRSPYDRSGRFLSPHIPEYTGSYDPKVPTTAEQSPNGIPIWDEGIQNGYYPSDRIKAGRDFDQFIAVSILGYRAEGLLAAGTLAPSVVNLGKQLAGLFIFQTFGIKLEYLENLYNFWHSNTALNAVLAPTLELPPIGSGALQIRHRVSARLNLRLWTPGVNAGLATWGFGRSPDDPDAPLTQPPSLLYGQASLGFMTYRSSDPTVGWKLLLGLDLGSALGPHLGGLAWAAPLLEFSASRNHEDDLVGAISKFNETIFNIKYRMIFGARGGR